MAEETLPPARSRIRGRIIQTSGRPVVRANVALRASCVLDSRGILARGKTDWEGRFCFDEVPASDEVWLEADALYYLRARGPSFPIGPGEELDAGTITLRFGGSLEGDVLDGDGRRVPHAKVVLAPLQAVEDRAGASSRTDSKGTFVLSALEPGRYTLEVQVDGAVAATFAGLWIQADAPTVQVLLPIDGNPLTFPEEQDPQQFRLYRAESVGEEVVANGSRRFESPEEIQEYVDGMVASQWWQSVFPRVEAIEVRTGKEETDFARGAPDFFWDETESSWGSGPDGHIELPRWAWRELVVLHEVSHVLSPRSRHGQLFARTFHDLVARMLGESAAAELARAYAAEGVDW